MTTDIVGATAAQEQLLREILAGEAPTPIERVAISPADPDWGATDPDAVTIRVDYAVREEVRGLWEASLLAAVFASKSRDAGLPQVAALETTTSSKPLLGDVGPIRGRRPVTRDQLASAISTAAKTGKAELVDMRITKPDHLAAAVTLRVQDPASFLKHRLRRFLESVPSPARTEYDGLYICVVDAKDSHAWSLGRTATPSQWGGASSVRPDLEGCDPLVQIGTPLFAKPPPPCPSD